MHHSSFVFVRCVLLVLSSAAFACGGAQHTEAAPVATGPEELSFEAATIHPGDTDAPEAPPTGSVATQAARRSVDSRHGAIAQCYATLLRTTPDAVGRIATEIVIAGNGHVERVSGRTEGEGGIGNARVCVETALRGLEIPNPPAAGLRIHRSYSFVNPPLELTLATPITVSPPVHVAAGHHSAVASAAPSAAPSGPAEGATGPLTLAELSSALAAHGAELSTCYATALRTAHTAAGAGSLVLTLGGDGTVSAAEFTSEAAAVASMHECIGTAMRAVRFRSSGTGATVHVPMVFAR